MNYLCENCKNNNNGWCTANKFNGLKKKNIQECAMYNSILIEESKPLEEPQQYFCKTQLNFGDAIQVIKNGGKVARNGWNGKGMFIAGQFPDLNSKMSKPYIYIKSAKGDNIPWNASQEDIFAEDWEVV